MKKKSMRKRTRNNRAWIWIVTGLVAAVVVVAALILANQTTATPQPATTALTECGKPTCGQANAPVTVEEYSDFQ